MHVDERVICALRLSRAGQEHAPRVDRPSALHCSAPPPRCHILLATEMVFLPVAQMGVIGGSNDESYTQTDQSGPLKVMGDPHGQPWLKKVKKR